MRDVMADDEQSSKTEEPTSRRLQQARERGQVAQSQDVRTWAVLAGGTLALAFCRAGSRRAPGARLPALHRRPGAHRPRRGDRARPASRASFWTSAGCWRRSCCCSRARGRLGSGAIRTDLGAQPDPAGVRQDLAAEGLAAPGIEQCAGGIRERAAETRRRGGGDDGAADSSARGAGNLAGRFPLAATVDRATHLLVRLSGAIAAVMTILAIRRLRLPAVQLSEADADDQAGVARRIQAVGRRSRTSSRAFVDCVRNERRSG